MKVMLGGREDVEAGFVGEDRELAQLVQHLLIALVVPADRPQTLSLLKVRRHRREHEKHEFHQVLPPIIVGYGREDSRCSGSKQFEPRASLCSRVEFRSLARSASVIDRSL
jgi:hypothetical protein